MDKRDDQQNDTAVTAEQPQRPRLTIVRNEEPAKAKVSPFVAFMTAYADAIDREVKAIMDL